MKKNVIILLLNCFLPFCLHAQVNYCDTILKQAYHDLAGKSDSSIQLALKKLNDAERCDYTNSLLKERQQLQTTIFDTIRNRKTQLDKAYLTLEKQSNTLTIRNIELINKRKAIDSLLTYAKNQAFKTAPSEYARLIHDGPSKVNDNENKFYESSYLLAYTQHFDQLKDSIEKINLGDTSKPIKDTVAKRVYNSIRDKLYYNNELYERVYSAFRRYAKNDNNNLVFDQVDSSMFKDVKERKIYDVKHYKRLEEIKTAEADECNQLNFFFTDDNYIYVCGKEKERDTIYMGARVTALDYDDTEKNIYFGTAGGYIGFIKYSHSAKKYQPVFENKLESEITAIRFFEYTDSSKDKNRFLLAVAKTSSARLYKLDSTLKEEKTLVGNILPYKNDYGEIENAVVDRDRGRIILKTSIKDKQVFYSWNPFTYNLLPILKENENFVTGKDNSDPLIKKTNLLMSKTKVY